MQTEIGLHTFNAILAYNTECEYTAYAQTHDARRDKNR